jgi:hypothetical protein
MAELPYVCKLRIIVYLPESIRMTGLRRGLEDIQTTI